MALLWTEGFGGYGTAAYPTNIQTYLARRYTAGAANFYLVNPGRVSGCFGCYSNGTNDLLTTPALGTTADTMVIGLAVQLQSSTEEAYSRTIFQFKDGSTLGIDVKRNFVSGEIEVYRNTTLLGITSGAGLLVNVWAYVEVKIKCSSSAGTVDVRVNGVSRLSLTGQNTKNGTDNYHNVAVIGCSNYFVIADVYVLDNTGTLNNDFLGNVKVVPLFPSGDTATLQWTPSAAGTHYTLVNETKDDDDTSYVQDATSGQVDLWSYQSAPALGAIVGIQVNTTCRDTDANNFSLITRVVSGATVSNDSAQAVNTTSYVSKKRVVETDPNTGGAWGASGLNAAQFGVVVG
jgi:hypothetical protein